MKPPENLAAELQAELVTKRLGRLAQVHESLPSSQDEARRLAAAGSSHGTLVWALAQTAGRGRMDRSWVSPAGGGLWFSIILRPQLPPTEAAFLGLVAGVAVAEAIAAEAALNVRLKWPNDLLLGGRKLGGILAEAEVVAASLRWLVLGIGVNLLPLPDGTDGDVVARATSLAEWTASVPPLPRLLARVLMALEQRYEELLAGGPEASLARWLELSDTIGRRVQAMLAGRDVVGEAVDLAPDGSLVIRTDSGEVVRLRSGVVVEPLSNR